ncbi:NUDIX domain-containing protein [Granulicella sibirica]|uniref:MutT-like protein n=1 Tax=Granulicella sibirica TaxID=2479048 RepID=A0A4Q0T4V8_9BACT|nr:NUDIX domain-containing protein [Granulicella sibirica]RXH58723.1 MutT-like protein [Granulicella sibirica]
MPKRSAGLLLYRRTQGFPEVLLVHPGGPFWAKKDKGAWTIPKGEYPDDEAPLAAAIREFTEETGFPVQEPFLPLGTIKQAGGKLVSAWAFEGDCDPARLVSNTFAMEWPPRSGRMIETPEVDRARWFSLAEAAESILPSQSPLLDKLAHSLRQS